MMIVSYIILGWLAFVFFAHLPFIPLINLWSTDVPAHHKKAATKCFIEAWLKNALTILPDILSPIVVPIALLYTKKEDNKLPKLFEWWDNDASINGDQADGEETYYAIGHDRRSFYARFIWLGLRNRASRLSQMLGYRHENGIDVELWKNGDADGAKNGWKLYRVNDKYRWFHTKKFGPIFFRFHYGYKVPRIPDRESASVVAIGFSFQRFD